jgi:hypothetical protein
LGERQTFLVDWLVVKLDVAPGGGTRPSSIVRDLA